MANRKISELQSRTPALSDLMLVGDPSSGYSYKCTVTALATIIETDIADGFVTIGTTQTVSGAKTFSNNLTLTSVANTPTDPDKFLTLNASNVVTYRTGAEVLSDIGGQGSITLTTTGTSGAATLVGNTLNIPQYQSALTNPVTGTGTTNYVTKWTSSSAVGNSQIIDNGTAIGIGTAPSNAYILSVAGIYRGVGVGNASRIELYDTQSGGATFFISPQESLGVTSLGTYGAFPILFITNATERIRIASAGDVTISTIANATVDTDKFLVSDSGVIKYRTGAEVLSDIGGASSSSISGTTNYIPKFTSSSAIGNSVIYESSSNIGIGTTSPAAKLDVQGSSSDQIRLRTAATEYYGIGRNSSTGYLDFYGSQSGYVGYLFGGVNGTRMTLNASGNLGLGVTPSASTSNYRTFEIGTTGINYSIFGQRIAGASEAFVGWNAYGGTNSTSNGSGFYYKITGDASTLYTLAADHRWWVAPSGTAGNAISFTQAMTLDASGRLGIGTTSPTQKLEVAGNILVSYANPDVNGIQINATTGTNAAAMEFTNTGGNFFVGKDNSTGSRITGTAYANAVWGESAYPLVFGTNNTERMRITSAGLVGIGTTSPAANGVGGSPTILQINNSSTSVAILGLSNQDNSSGAVPGLLNFVSAGLSGSDKRLAEIYAIKGDASTSTPNGSLIFSTANSATVSERMRITSGGNVGIGTTNPSAPLTVTGNISLGNRASSGTSYIGKLREDNGGISNAYGIGFVNSDINGAGYINFYTTTVGGSGDTRMTITGSGNVGIGTSTPGSKLSVVGLPTSSAGLSAGDIWNDGGTLKIV